jgi:putative ABC transport system permease protein
MSVDSWRQDLQIAGRSLWRARGFAALAAVTLAVGIAGSTAMFALIQGVLLRPLPIPEQDRVFVAWTQPRGGGFNHVPYVLPNIERIGRETALLESVSAVTYNGTVPFIVVDQGLPAYIDGTAVGGRFFEVLGATPILGRALTPDDDRSGTDGAVVIAHRLWQQRYGGTPAVIGRRLTIAERPYTIVGVMPPDVEYPRGAQVWIPLAQHHARQIAADPNYRVDVDLIARMKPAVALSQASAELQLLTTRLEAERVGVFSPRDLIPIVTPYEEIVVGDARTAVLVLFVAVGLVLVVASANVANLLLLRGEQRRPELAMRSALGAGRWRLARLIFAESLLLALAAGMLGATGASWMLRAVSLVPAGSLPRLDAIRIDGVVLLFTTAVALAAAFLAALPALASSSVDLTAALRSESRTVAGSTRLGRRALVVAQVALAVLVVAIAAGLTHSLLRLQSLDMGMSADRLVVVPLSIPTAVSADRVRHVQLIEELTQRLEDTGPIDAATAVHVQPFAGTGGWDVPRFAADGQSADEAAANVGLNLESVRPNYFSTFGISVLRGRGFARGDREGTPAVVIVSQDVADRTWPGQDPIGKRVKFGSADSTAEWRTVVGVVGATRYRELAVPRPSIYLPADQFIPTAHHLVLRTAAPLAVVADTVRATVAAIDDSVKVMRVAPFADLLDKPLARPRFNAALLALFGATALALSAIGLYGVMAASVRQRQREIGLRVSLGATVRDVHALVLGEGARLTIAGALLGLAAAVVAGRLVSSLLTVAEPLGAVSLVSAAALTVAAALSACYVPARRAARVDAATMLRGD